MGKSTSGGGATTTIGYSGDGGRRSRQSSATRSNRRCKRRTLYIADTYNKPDRKIDPAGSTISRVAGNGQGGDSARRPGIIGVGDASLSVALDAAGNLYVGETGVVRQITPTGVIGPYAGNGPSSFSGERGPALSARSPGRRSGGGFRETTYIFPQWATAASAWCSPRPAR